MAEEPVQLIEPCEALREAFVEYVEEFRRAGEELWVHRRGQVRGDFAGFLRELRDAAAGVNLPPDRVPETHYWLVRGSRILGVVRLRHRLTESLAVEGGHIGYDVRPSERRKGYGKRMLAMALEKARQRGIRRALVTCDKDNVASARVIRANGGQLHSEVPSPRSGKLVQRYWIPLPASRGTQTRGSAR
jgi:predicted acetyltransferase